MSPEEQAEQAARDWFIEHINDETRRDWDHVVEQVDRLWPLMVAAASELVDGRDVAEHTRVMDRVFGTLRAIDPEMLMQMVVQLAWPDVWADACEARKRMNEQLEGLIKPAPQCPTPELHAQYHGRSETYRRQLANGVAVPTTPGVCDWCGLAIPGGSR